MKKLTALLILLSTFLLFQYCGNKTEKKEAGEKTELASESIDKPEPENKESTPSNTRWEARKQIGDTMAMPYKDLQNYLPEISGYSKDGGPKGSQVNMPGMGSWSQTEQDYSNGDKNVSVKIVDYNSAQQTFLGVTQIYKMAVSSEDDQKKEGAVDLGMKDIAGYETIYKDGSRAQLVLIVADRFFIEIESNGNNDSDFIRSVAKNMKLGELANK